jgi:hypothetical protein
MIFRSFEKTLFKRSHSLKRSLVLVFKYQFVSSFEHPFGLFSPKKTTTATSILARVASIEKSFINDTSSRLAKGKKTRQIFSDGSRGEETF